DTLFDDTLSRLRRDVDRVFNDFFVNTKTDNTGLIGGGVGFFSPRVDAELPGVPKENVNVEVQDNNLVISGENKDESTRETDSGWIRERRFGRFQRVISLPFNVNSDKTKAKFSDGILEITVEETITTEKLILTSPNSVNTISTTIITNIDEDLNRLSKKMEKRVVTFQARTSQLDRETLETHKDPFRGFFTLFWIGMVFYTLKVELSEWALRLKYLKQEHARLVGASKKSDYEGNESENQQEVNKLESQIKQVEGYLKSPAGNISYPNNITITNFVDFLLVPTLVYELEYPRTEK
ncbi:13681_t:CDS:2, partial [Acaulospora colombiana]